MSWNPFSSELTDNFKANVLLTPIALMVYQLFLSFTHSRFGLLLDWQLSIIFVLIYIYASRFYQPDLDHRSNRPGKAHFPFGKTVSVFLMGRKDLLGKALKIFSIFQVVSAKLWFWFWQPFTYLVTHRGATHIPVFGTFLRSLYMYLGVKLAIVIHVLISSELLRMGHDSQVKIFSVLFISLGNLPFEKILAPLSGFFKSMCFFSGVDKFFVIYCLPIYIADIIHEAVDMYDSFRRGTGYCSTPSEHWGIVKRIFPRLPF